MISPRIFRSFYDELQKIAAIGAATMLPGMSSAAHAAGSMLQHANPRSAAKGIAGLRLPTMTPLSQIEHEGLLSHHALSAPTSTKALGGGGSLRPGMSAATVRPGAQMATVRPGMAA